MFLGDVGHPPPPPTHKAMFVSDLPVIDCPRELTAAASEAVAFGGRIAGNIMMLVLSGCAVRLDVISLLVLSGCTVRLDVISAGV